MYNTYDDPTFQVAVPRTVLVADPNDGSRERVSEVVRALGYWVLEARTPVEVSSALDACPISCMVVDDGLLFGCDLRWVLVRVPVIVLSDARRDVAHHVGVVPKYASLEELPAALATLIGHPRYRGPRDVVALRHANEVTRRYPAETPSALAPSRAASGRGPGR